MANTRQSAKRARQADKRRERNLIIKSSTKTAVKAAVLAITKKEASAAEAYMSAIKALSKAASKGSIPSRRAARKISRLTLLLKKAAPSALVADQAKEKKTAAKKAPAKAKKA
jgi:small subunit ribosomal protein S20